jgi:hypothetical protein
MEPAIVVLVVLLVVAMLVGGGIGIWLLARPKKEEDEDEVVTFAPPPPAPRAAAPSAPLPPIYLAYPDEAPARIRTSDPKVVVAPPRAAPPISLPLPLTLPTFSKPVIAAPRPPSVHVVGFPSKPPAIPPIPQVKPKGTCGVGTVWDSGKKICRAPKSPAGGTKYPAWANKSQTNRDIYDRAIEAQRRIKAARGGK